MKKGGGIADFGALKGDAAVDCEAGRPYMTR